MSKAFGFCFHVSLTVLNALLCLTSLVSGHFTWALGNGGLAAIRAWQLTW
jgi:hypothetical protein